AFPWLTPAFRIPAPGVFSGPTRTLEVAPAGTDGNVRRIFTRRRSVRVWVSHTASTRKRYCAAVMAFSTNRSGKDRLPTRTALDFSISRRLRRPMAARRTLTMAYPGFSPTPDPLRLTGRTTATE